MPQYHVWEVTYFYDGQWIQPVSLSEYDFTGFHQVQDKLQTGLTDIAVNVFSDELGVTGWVSKWQKTRVEMPHLGYWVNETTLVWFCQINEPEKLVTIDNRWFVFLETVDRSPNPIEYQIYGVQIIVGETLSLVPGQVGKHFGTYYSTTSIHASEED
ncbi:hypothetical protein GWN42_19315 [candidate division KSB1 bacterium]|nr:hypothetical protein [candidate division KSB1 bacterium]